MKSEVNRSLDRTLESIVIASWDDLMHDAQTGLIHIEYSFAPTGKLNYLKIWSSLTRGHWLLACEYWMSESTSHGAGVRFDNGYESESFSDNLDRVMQHQTSFILPENLGRPGLLQVSTPTLEEAAAAGEWLRDAFDPLDATLAEPALA